MAYQSDIARQFEFVQSAWVNDRDFPQPDAGQDPIIANSVPQVRPGSPPAGAMKGCPFHRLADATACPVAFQHFVKTRGGGYFFSPSIGTLTDWIGN